MPKVNQPNPGFQSDILEKEKVETVEPPKYSVVFHNDDFTTQEFVIHILVSFFYLDLPTSERIMLKIHKEGRAKVGLYTKDIALSKVALVISYSRENEMPLLLTVEPE